MLAGGGFTASGPASSSVPYELVSPVFMSRTRTSSALRMTTFAAPTRSACLSWPLIERPACSIWARLPPRAQVAEQPEAVSPVAAVLDRDEHVGAALLGVLVARGEQDPLHPGGEADAGHVRAAELLGQQVVAAAAGHAGLGAERVARELEHRARVVVEAAHERRVDLVLDARRVEHRRDLVEVLLVLGLDAVEQPRRVLHHALGAAVVGVERAQRVGVDAAAHLVGQLVLVLLQVGAQVVGVLAARLGRPQRSDAEPQLARARLLQQVAQQHDDLGVERRVVGADRLGADLRELAVPAGLRRLVPEVRADVAQLHRLRPLVHAVLEVGAHDRRGPLRAQRQRAAAHVLEGEHLLLDDVGGLPHAAREQLGALEDRRLDHAVAGVVEQVVGEPLERLAPLPVVGQHVERAPRGLELLARHRR